MNSKYLFKEKNRWIFSTKCNKFVSLNIKTTTKFYQMLRLVLITKWLKSNLRWILYTKCYFIPQQNVVRARTEWENTLTTPLCIYAPNWCDVIVMTTAHAFTQTHICVYCAYTQLHTTLETNTGTTNKRATYHICDMWSNTNKQYCYETHAT